MATSHAAVSIWYVVGFAIILIAIFLGCTSGNKVRANPGAGDPLWVKVTALVVIILILYRVSVYFPHIMHVIDMLNR